MNNTTGAGSDSFDVAVVGLGMIGSAALRHLAERGYRVVGLGPDEPADRRSSAGPFCSHPDEGRITRIAGRTPVWSEVAARSIERYADIERRSGIRFHTGCGLVSVSPIAEEWISNSHRSGGDARQVDASWVRGHSGIEIANGLPIAYEGPPAGYINPRRLVAAQQLLAERAGAVIVRAAATSLEPVDRGRRVGGAFGGVVASRVLVATGGFGSQLLDRALALHRMPRTTVTAELDGFADLPSLICVDPPDERLDEIYWVPPVRYRDGRVALKIGGSLRDSTPVDEEALGPWFRSQGSAVEVDALRTSLLALLPGAQVRSWAEKPCVVTNTDTGHPFIGWVDPAETVAVAIGGNGSAAKSSDELGRLASTLFDADGWTDSIDLGMFTPAFS